ncbi:MAG: ribosome biogenesis GTPase Der [Christensenellales bacterium]|jgi:GTP-binding protein
MNKPLVAIIGRPNVGKSTIFNKISGQRKSIVDNLPGVTRDRIYADAEWRSYQFTLIDTGGIEVKSKDEMWSQIRAQAEAAVDIADVILFVTDGKQGLLPDDYDIADFLRASRKPVVLCVNKMDNVQNVFEFYSLGMGDPIPTSAEHGKNLGDLLDAVVSHFDERKEADEDKDNIKIAVIGKPNAGKSSLVNKILGYERVIVTNIPGTTRDSVDTPFTYDNKDYVIIDTAGIRRKSKVKEDLEYYSVVRAIGSLRNADVAVIVVDAVERITDQDLRICALTHEAGKPSVIVINKWDIIEKDAFTINEFNKHLAVQLRFMPYFKAVFASALTGQRVGKILEAVNQVYSSARQRISTGVLNDVMQQAILAQEPPYKGGGRLKIYYMTQASVAPPTFVLFVNDGRLMHFTYKRYLENYLRKAFDFTGTPIKIMIKNKID